MNKLEKENLVRGLFCLANYIVYSNCSAQSQNKSCSDKMSERAGQELKLANDYLVKFIRI